MKTRFLIGNLSAHIKLAIYSGVFFIFQQMMWFVCTDYVLILKYLLMNVSVGVWYCCCILLLSDGLVLKRDDQAQLTYIQMELGPGLNIKTVFLMYGDSHVKDKIIGETVLSLTWESLYW